LDGAKGVALPVAIVALTASGLVVVSGWNRRREWLARQGQPSVGNRFELGQMPFAAGDLDVAAEARDVLRQFDSLAARLLVDLEFAVQPQLAVRADRRAFREILSDMVTTAIEQAPCGHVLLGAARTGNRVHITVSDDGGNPNREMRLSKLRSAERLAALQGATMEVDVRNGQGTTVFFRLPVTATGRSTMKASDPIDLESNWGERHNVHQPHDAAP
jgi:signal transduction histidine kinase